MNSLEDDHFSNTPPEIAEKAHSVTINLLPIKCREKYDCQYDVWVVAYSKQL